jgi:hypothetical protein
LGVQQLGQLGGGTAIGTGLHAGEDGLLLTGHISNGHGNPSNLKMKTIFKL